MTSPPAVERDTVRTSPREDADSRRNIGLLQDALRGMSKRDACDHLAGLFPHRSRPWFVRHLEEITRLDPATFERLMYADPTGEAAAHNVDQERSAA